MLLPYLLLFWCLHVSYPSPEFMADEKSVGSSVSRGRRQLLSSSLSLPPASMYLPPPCHHLREPPLLLLKIQYFPEAFAFRDRSCHPPSFVVIHLSEAFPLTRGGIPTRCTTSPSTISLLSGVVPLTGGGTSFSNPKWIPLFRVSTRFGLGRRPLWALSPFKYMVKFYLSPINLIYEDKSFYLGFGQNTNTHECHLVIRLHSRSMYHWFSLAIGWLFQSSELMFQRAHLFVQLSIVTTELGFGQDLFQVQDFVFNYYPRPPVCLRFSTGHFLNYVMLYYGCC